MREPGQIKRAPRVTTCQRATLVDIRGDESTGLVTDISRYGFQIETSQPLRIGERVRLIVDRYGNHAAQVRWTRDLVAGCVFLDPVNLD